MSLDSRSRPTHSPRRAAFVFAGFAVALTATSLSAPQGGGVSVPNTFAAGSPARAAEVNQNFDALVAEIVALEARLAQLEDVTRFLSVDENDVAGMNGPNLIIEGANVHVRSGSGATDDGGATTGLGNVVIGYTDLGTLTPADRSGAHNLVLGDRNAYTSFGGIVAGTDNRISNEFASITGGRFGTASGRYATITGGGGDTDNLFNTASGEYAAIVAGFRNVASGNQSAVTGGSNHEATGLLSAVSGGTGNIASGAGAAVSGGAGNDAQESNSSICGGQGGVATGVSSTISGGLDRTVTINFDCADCN